MSKSQRTSKSRKSSGRDRKAHSDTAKKQRNQKPAAAPSTKGEKLGAIFRIVFVFIVAMMITLTGVYRDVERQVSDLSVYFAGIPGDRNQVVIVSITDDDYEKLFKSESPLNPARLNDVIKAISDLKPKVIGVDIDTSTEKFRALEPNNGNIPIVWAADIVQDQDHSLVEMIGPLGGRELPAQNFAAPILLPIDSDDKTRHYQTELEMKDVTAAHFARKLFSLYDPVAAASRDRTSDMKFIHFAGYAKENVISYRVNLPALTVMDLAKNNAPGDIFKDKIVILGGYYHQNRAERALDIHNTPLGEIYGTDLLASVVETEIAGGGAKPVGAIGGMLLNFVAGVIIAFLFFRFDLFRAVLFSLIGIAAISLLTAAVSSNFLTFPALLFLLLLAVADAAKDYFRTILGALYEKVSAADAGGANKK